MNNIGFVSFVGAGPGDVGLATQKSIQCIKKADVILYDRLANPRLLKYAKESCEFIYCGKLPNRHILRQEKINEMLVQYASRGKYVVRLKGGDPSVFGRVGEEAEYLVNHNLNYEIVPGVTSSVAAATYAGIPVTHRNYSNSFTIRTGHTCEENTISLPKENHLDETIAYYMGVKNLEKNCEQLIKAGKPTHTPVAVIEWGTTGKQRVVEGALQSISTLIQAENIKNPAMTIVGEVVSLRSKISWFEKKRFFGKKVLIVQPNIIENDLETYFRENGAETFAFPVVQKTIFKFSDQDFQQVLAQEKIIFASPESVTTFFDQFFKAGYTIWDLPRQFEFTCEDTHNILCEKGLNPRKFKAGDQKTAALIRPRDDFNYERFDENTLMIDSHELTIDQRFNEIIERILTEDSWDTVVFTSKASVDHYLNELKQLGLKGYRDIRFAYIGDSVKDYAFKNGFGLIDDEVQDELIEKHNQEGKINARSTISI